MVWRRLGTNTHRVSSFSFPLFSKIAAEGIRFIDTTQTLDGEKRRVSHKMTHVFRYAALHFPLAMPAIPFSPGSFHGGLLHHFGKRILEYLKGDFNKRWGTHSYSGFSVLSESYLVPHPQISPDNMRCCWKAALFVF